MTDDPCIGDRGFTDGSTKPVYLDGDGKMYVWDDGQRMYGEWLGSQDDQADEPDIVEGTS